jgi:hypothetical protein
MEMVWVVTLVLLVVTNVSEEHIFKMLVTTYKTTCIDPIFRVEVLPWRWRRYVPPKCWLPHGITTQNNTLLFNSCEKLKFPNKTFQHFIWCLRVLGVILCNFVSGYQHHIGTYCPHLRFSLEDGGRMFIWIVFIVVWILFLVSNVNVCGLDGWGSTSQHKLGLFYATISRTMQPAFYPSL